MFVLGEGFWKMIDFEMGLVSLNEAVERQRVVFLHFQKTLSVDS